MTVYKGSKYRLTILMVLLALSLGYFLFPIYTIDLSAIPFSPFNQRYQYYKTMVNNAGQGDVNAQLTLAIMYGKGNGVDQDYEKAVYWYTKAAEQGNAQAQNNLGVRYELGEIVNKDDEKAVYWYTKAADQNYAMAVNNLGGLYFRKGNDDEAFPWYLKAAELGYIKAQVFVGVAYEEGNGTPKSIENAIYWYKKAAASGDGLAQQALGTKYRLGDGVEKDPKQAGYWYKKAANNGLEKVQNFMKKKVDVCTTLVAPSSDHIEACFIAAGAGAPDAQSMLSLFYYHGQGVPQDKIESLAWGLVNGNIKIKEKPDDPLLIRAVAAELLLLRELSRDEIENAATKAKEYRGKYGAY